MLLHAAAIYFFKRKKALTTHFGQGHQLGTMLGCGGPILKLLMGPRHMRAATLSHLFHISCAVVFQNFHFIQTLDPKLASLFKV